MIPYDIDPSLHSSTPRPEQLDDGFSAPRPPQPVPPPDGAASSLEDALATQSDF